MQIWDLIPHCLWSGGRPSKRTLYTAMSGVWRYEEIDEFKLSLVGLIAGFWRRNPPLVTILSLLEDRVKGFKIYQLHTVCIRLQFFSYRQDWNCSISKGLSLQTLNSMDDRFGGEIWSRFVSKHCCYSAVNSAWTVCMNSAHSVLLGNHISSPNRAAIRWVAKLDIYHQISINSDHIISRFFYTRL